MENETTWVVSKRMSSRCGMQIQYNEKIDGKSQGPAGLLGLLTKEEEGCRSRPFGCPITLAPIGKRDASLKEGTKGKGEELGSNSFSSLRKKGDQGTVQKQKQSITRTGDCSWKENNAKKTGGKTEALTFTQKSDRNKILKRGGGIE